MADCTATVEGRDEFRALFECDPESADVAADICTTKRLKPGVCGAEFNEWIRRTVGPCDMDLQCAPVACEGGPSVVFCSAGECADSAQAACGRIPCVDPVDCPLLICGGINADDTYGACIDGFCESECRSGN